MKKATAALGLTLLLAWGIFLTNQRAAVYSQSLPAAQPEKKLNILLVSICSLSRDVLGLKGDFDGRTAMHDFAEKAYVFDNYYSSHPWLNIGQFTYPRISPEYLRGLGYSYFVRSGMDLFVRVPAQIIPTLEFPKTVIEERDNLADLRRLTSIRNLLPTLRPPFFVALHIKYMHFPYYDFRNPAFRRTFRLPPNLTQRLSELDQKEPLEDFEAVPAALLFGRFDPNKVKGIFNLLEDKNLVDRWRAAPTFSLDLELVKAIYRAKFAYLARALEPLLNLDDNKSLQQNTVVIIDGDHGEAFMEHGRIGHASGLYDEFIHSPLMIKFPGHRPGSTIHNQLDKVASAALIKDILEGNVTAETLPAWVNSHTPAFILSRDCGGTEYSVTTDNHFKYIHRFGDGSRELYNTAVDPLEKSNISSKEVPLAEELDEYILKKSPRLDDNYRIPSGSFMDPCSRE